MKHKVFLQKDAHGFADKFACPEMVINGHTGRFRGVNNRIKK